MTITLLQGFTATGRYVHARRPGSERATCGTSVMTSAATFDPASSEACPRCVKTAAR